MTPVYNQNQLRPLLVQKLHSLLVMVLHLVTSIKNCVEGMRKEYFTFWCNCGRPILPLKNHHACKMLSYACREAVMGACPPLHESATRHVRIINQLFANASRHNGTGLHRFCFDFGFSCGQETGPAVIRVKVWALVYRMLRCSARQALTARSDEILARFSCFSQTCYLVVGFVYWATFWCSACF